MRPLPLLVRHRRAAAIHTHNGGEIEHYVFVRDGEDVQRVVDHDMRDRINDRTPVMSARALVYLSIAIFNPVHPFSPS